MSDNKPKVLIVDDVPSNHRVYERILESLDLDIEKAVSGQKALELALCYDFFLILMDVNMPGMDGFETASLILDHPKTEHIPVIFITAIATDEIFEFKGYKSGAIDYMTKPINDDILRSKVRIFLEIHQQKERLQNTLKELKKTYNDLENKNMSIREFTKMVSGDMEAPLNLLSGTILLLSTELEDKGLENGQVYIQRIDKFFKHLKSKIEVLLKQTKMPTNNLKYTNVKLNQVTDESITQLSYLKEKTKGSITRDDLPSIMANEDQIKRLFGALLKNGLQYRREGIPPKVHITGNCAGNLVKLTFKDNGIGFDEDFIEWIFTPFKRLVQSPFMDGTGMGLAYAKSIVTQMGGVISAKSQPDKGSEFIVILPIGMDPE